MLQRKSGGNPFASEAGYTAATDADADTVDNVRSTMAIRRVTAMELEAAMKSGDLSGVLKAIRLLDPRTFDN